MQPSRQDIENAARLVPERMAPEFGDGMAWNEYRDDARPWQPWADTEAGRSDALVLLAAVHEWVQRPVEYSGIRLRCKWEIATALNTGNVQQIQAATFAAAVAIGAHIQEQTP